MALVSSLIFKCYLLNTYTYVSLQPSCHIEIAINPTFYEQTNHIKKKYHYIQYEVLKSVISMPYVASSSQLADIFTKPLSNISYGS